MRLYFIFQILIYLLLFSTCKEKQGNSVSTPYYIPENTSQSRVVDLAHLFSDNEHNMLVDKILAYERTSTNQIAVLTIDSLPKQTAIQYYGTQVAHFWGVGTKEKNNGLLITISKYDRQVAISTGTGTEKLISDYECKVVIDSSIIPQFRNKNYYDGVYDALDSLILLWE